jgi:N4-(beta-N-acetylglucosaminyl)-L-asparaginase
VDGDNGFKAWANKENHDTIGMVSLDATTGNMAGGTSTNGANHKIAGRVGDSPIPGSSCFVNSAVGGAAATGDGDVMMRFSPSFAAGMYMEMGASPTTSYQKALAPISAAFPSFSAALYAYRRMATVGAATYNMDFSYSFMADGMESVEAVVVN